MQEGTREADLEAGEAAAEMVALVGSLEVALVGRVVAAKEEELEEVAMGMAMAAAMADK